MRCSQMFPLSCLRRERGLGGEGERSVTQFAQLVVNGLITGSILALAAVGATLIFGIQLGWWGHAGMLKPLLELAGQ